MNNYEQTKKLRILHVDDDNLALELTKMYLERMNPDVEIVPFTSGTSALDSFKQQDFDCVLSDFHMPVLDGLALMRRMRKIKPQIPFILLSGDDREDVAVTALLSGVNDYLIKGMQSEDYAEILARVYKHLRVPADDQIGKENQKQRLLTLLGKFSSAAYIVSEEGRIIYSNKEFTKRYGNSSEQKCHKAVMGRDEPCSMCIMHGTGLNKTPGFSECTTKQGSFVRVFSHPVHSLGGKHVLHMILNGTA